MKENANMSSKFEIFNIESLWFNEKVFTCTYPIGYFLNVDWYILELTNIRSSFNQFRIFSFLFQI